MFLEMELDVFILLMVVAMIVAPIIILAIVVFIVQVVKRAKKAKNAPKIKLKDIHIQYTDEGDEELFNLFGENNIVSVDCEMSRVTVEVKDIELVNTTLLQEKGASGILLVGNKVKCNFKENSEDIANYLKGKINND